MTNKTLDKSMVPNQNGRFGNYGGKFVPETLMPALEELEQEYQNAIVDSKFNDEFRNISATKTIIK